MRLIDADALLTQVRQIDFLKVSNSTKISACEIMAIINKQPTAFDTKKVVENLETLHDLVKINQKLAVSQAIDIVKKGGVE